MKQNKYNDKTFFEKYSQMQRSVKGLDGAGEWETLKSLLPSFKDARVLDLGCGFGWHCIYAMQNGAKQAIGIDLSENMLAVAREKTEFDNVSYECMAIEDIDFAPQSFDVVISSLALHYVKSFESVASTVYDVLTDGGTFIFSAEHPIFTAEGRQDWVYDEAGNILHFPVDNYFYEGERVANFLGEDVLKYHKTLTTYLNGLLECGFTIKNVVEPQPSEHLCNTVDGMKDELRRPMMLIVSAVK